MERNCSIIPNKSYLNGGQALLIVLLALSVALAGVLAAVSRSITDISTSTYEENSTRAFNLAEAGVERALKAQSLSPGSGNIPPIGGTYQYTVTASGANATEFIYPLLLSEGEYATFWFVSHASDQNSGIDFECSGAGFPCYGDTTNRFEICWGDASVTPAVEVSLYYDSSPTFLAVNNSDFSGMRVVRQTYDPDPVRATSNNFTNVNGISCVFPSGDTFSHGTSYINWLNIMTGYPGCSGARCMIMARVRMFYSGSTPQPVGIRVPTDGLPAQGLMVNSLGSAQGSQRRINVYQSYPEPPWIFESSLFSENDIVHNN